jgi:hypothetical protein
MMQTDVQAAYVKSSGVTVTPLRTRLKGCAITSATSSLRNVAACDPTTVVSGTYSQTGTTATITITNHGLTNGQRVFVDFTTGTSRDGAYDITYIDANSFSVTTANSVSTSGNVSVYPDIYMEIDTYSTVGLFILIPGEGILFPNGLFFGCGPSVTAMIYYG